MHASEDEKNLLKRQSYVRIIYLKLKPAIGHFPNPIELRVRTRAGEEGRNCFDFKLKLSVMDASTKTHFSSLESHVSLMFNDYKLLPGGFI